MTIRPAEIGDKGVLLSLEGHGSIGTLILQVGDDERAQDPDGFGLSVARLSCGRVAHN